MQHIKSVFHVFLCTCCSELIGDSNKLPAAAELLLWLLLERINTAALNNSWAETQMCLFSSLGTFISNSLFIPDILGEAYLMSVVFSSSGNFPAVEWYLKSGGTKEWQDALKIYNLIRS